MLRTMMKARWQRHERELAKGAPPIVQRRKVCKVRKVPIDLNEPSAAYAPYPEQRRPYGEQPDGTWHLPGGRFRIGDLIVSVEESHVLEIPRGVKVPDTWPKLQPGRFGLRVPIAEVDIERSERSGKELDFRGRNPDVASPAFAREARTAFQFVRNLGYVGILAEPSDDRRHRVYRTLLWSIGCSVLDAPGFLIAFFVDCEMEGEDVRQWLADNVTPIVETEDTPEGV